MDNPKDQAKKAVENYLSEHGPTQEEGVSSCRVSLYEPKHYRGVPPYLEIRMTGEDSDQVKAAAEQLVTKLQQADIEPFRPQFASLREGRVLMTEQTRRRKVVGHIAMVRIDTYKGRSFSDLVEKFEAAASLRTNGLTSDQDELLDGLTSRKRPLSLDVLMDENHEPTEFLAALIKNELVGELFTEELWKGKSARELTDFYQALPESVQDCISNFHQLTAAISRKETAQTRVR